MISIYFRYHRVDLVASMISLKDVTGALSEANKDKQELSEALKQAKDENQKLVESLSKANDENEQLTLHLSEVNTLLETLRAENEEQTKFRERSEELIQKNLDLLTEKEELEKTLSQSKEEMTKKLELAERNEKELEEEMENWLLDAKSEKFKSTLSLQNLSECLNRETEQRMKADVTRELTDRDKEKLENLLREEQDKCKQLEIKTETQEFKVNQLQEIISQERTNHDKKLITEKYEKELIVKDLKIAGEREERLITVITEKETVLNKLNHDNEVIQKKNKELKKQLEKEKKKTESPLKEKQSEAESMLKDKLKGLQNEMVLKQVQLEEVQNEKHEQQVKLKNLQSKLNDTVIELEREKKLKCIMEEKMEQFKADLDKGIILINVFIFLITRMHSSTIHILF